MNRMRAGRWAVGLAILVQGVTSWGQATRYVVPGNPAASSPFTNWSTAAATIQAALDAAADGDTILATNGTYALTNTIWITNGITLRSLSGASNTVISGQHQVRGLYVAHTNAVIEGFTVTAGYVYDDVSDEYYSARIGEGRGGGIYVSNAFAIRSCVVRNCEAKGKGTTGWDGSWMYSSGPDSWNGYGLGGGIYVAQGGIIENCVIWSNRAEGIGGDGVFTLYGGGAPGDGYGYGAGVYVESNAPCEVRNCTIVQNEAIGTGGVYEWGGWPGSGYGYGGGISAGTNSAIYNSIVWSNTATTSSSNWFEGRFSYSCSEPRPDGAANLNQDPGFVQIATGNFHLASASSCMDVGTNQTWMSGATDLDGNPRIKHGFVDLGAYEYQGDSPEPYRLTKVVQSPHDARAAQVGEAVRFTLTVVNLGDVALATVPVEDRYETAFLTYVSSTPASANNTDDGVINWANIGPLAPGVSTSIMATFTAKASTSGQLHNNTVVAAPTGYPAKTNTAPYKICQAGYRLEKIVQAPHDTRAAATGETVRFTLTVVNTGDVALATVPLTDLYETNYLAYVSSVPGSADNNNDGAINWANVGSLASGASTSVVATFTAKASTAGQARTNTVVAVPTTAAGEPAVPATTNSASYSIAVFYTLTVNGGSGSGLYTNQQRVAIAADAPAVGMTFDRWTGDTQYLDSVTSSTTTVTMPAQSMTVAATYKPIHYALTVINGSGGGSYTNQQRVTVAANGPAVGMTFDRWMGDTQYVANAMSSTTTMTMPAHNTVLTATYKPIYYNLTVNGGSGSGSYTNQQRVAIAADPPAPGFIFAWWTGNAGFLDNASSANTTVTMPAYPISVTSTYRGCFLYVTNSTDTNTVTITGYIGSGGNVVVPAMLEEKAVTGIEPWVFQSNSNLTDIALPGTVTNVANSSFYNCISLTNVTIGNGVTSIGIAAFQNCFNLMVVSIPDSVTVIGGGAFAYCRNLPSVTIPAGVTVIGDEAFNGCHNLAGITIPENVSNLGGWIFNQCSNLAYAVIGNSVTNIGYYAFGNCTSLTNITIPNSVVSLSGRVFEGCRSMVSASIGNGVTNIEDNMFYDCSSLTNVLIPESVNRIGDWSFAYCSSVAEITIPGSVASIGDCAFYGSGLANVSIPDGVILIGNWAFSDCTSLTNAIIGNGVTNIGYGTFEMCASLAGINIGSNVVSIGDTAFSWCESLGDVSIPDNVRLIDRYAFGNCTSLTNLAFGNGVTNIGDSAFLGCDSLTVLAIGGGVKQIEGYAFADCDALESVIIPENVAQLGEWSFSWCSSLSNVFIGRGVSSIGEALFLGCTNLTTVTVDPANSNYCVVADVLFNKGANLLVQYPGGKSGHYDIPNGVTIIENWSFAFCQNLVTITIPDSVISIGENAFVDCNLQTITIPGSVTNIGQWAFSGCATLTNIAVDVANAFYSSIDGVLFNEGITMLIQCPGGRTGSYIVPESVTSIGSSSFNGCRNLTSIAIGLNVTNIGNSAFSGCNSMTNVMIPDSVVYLGDYAFSYCGNLFAVSIGNNVTGIGDHAFSGCAVLTNIVIPTSVTQIDDEAFGLCGFDKIIIPASVTNFGRSVFVYCTNLIEVYFMGDAPSYEENAIYYLTANPTIYYLPGTLGWGSTFAGQPTAMWRPEAQEDGSLGVKAGKYGFNVDWADGLTVVVEGSTNLIHPVWVPLATNTFTGGAYDFRDSQWTNCPGRYYRIRSEP